MALRVPLEHGDCLTFRKQQLSHQGSTCLQVPERWWNTVGLMEGQSRPLSNHNRILFQLHANTFPGGKTTTSRPRSGTFLLNLRSEQKLEKRHGASSHTLLSVQRVNVLILNYSPHSSSGPCCTLQQLRLSHQLRYTECRQFGSIGWSFRVSVIKNFTLAPPLSGFPNGFFFWFAVCFQKKKQKKQPPTGVQLQIFNWPQMQHFRPAGCLSGKWFCWWHSLKHTQRRRSNLTTALSLPWKAEYWGSHLDPLPCRVCALLTEQWGGIKSPGRHQAVRKGLMTQALSRRPLDSSNTCLETPSKVVK